MEMIPFIEEGNFTTHGKFAADLTYNPNNDFGSDKDHPRKIYIHINQLQINLDTVQVMQMSTENKVLGHEFDLERYFYVMHLENDLQVGSSIRLSMNFISILNNELNGFYRSSYKDESGATKYLAVTDFQKPDARKAFPCLDEPDLKARFRIKLGHKSEMIAVSNMPKISSEHMVNMPGYVMDTFQETVVMPTYLVAFLVSEFAERTTKTADGKDFRIWFNPMKYSQSELAFDSGPKIQDYLASVYDVPYDLPKQDMVALPDFLSGAMENWGLITYRFVSCN